MNMWTHKYAYTQTQKKGPMKQISHNPYYNMT